MRTAIHAAPLRFALLAMMFIGCVAIVRAQVPPAAPPQSTVPLPERLSSPIALEPDKTSVEVGEPVPVKAIIPTTGDFESIEVILPKDQAPRFVVGKPERRGPAEFLFTLRVLQSGDQQFGPVQFRVRPKGSENFIEMGAAPIAFTVKAPAGEPTMDLKDYTAPLALPFNYLYRNLIIAAATIAGIALLLAVGLLLYRILREKQKELARVPPPPPVDAALMEVRRLKRLDIFTESGAEKHYTMLSSVLRRYFEEQFHTNALELTEDEIVEFIKKRLSSLSGADSLVTVFRRMSMAKFAREEVTGDVAHDDCAVSEGFLQREKVRIEAERLAAQQRAKEAPAAPAREDRAA